MNNLNKLALVAILAAFFYAPALAQNAGTISNHAVPVGKGPGVTGFGSAVPGAAKLPLTSTGASTDPAFGVIQDQSTVIADPTKFWNPTYFGNAGTGLTWKLNRLQVGVEALSGSQVPETPTSWVKTLFTQDFMAASTIASTSALGQLGITGAARTSDYRTWVGGATGGAQGVTGISYNNDTGTGAPIGCGVCAIAVHGAGVTGVTLNQFDTSNMGGVVDVTPHGGVTAGSQYAMGLTPGAYTATALANVSAAIYLGGGANSKKFRTGIVSFFDALDTSVGSGGGGRFASLYAGQSIEWFDSANVQQTAIWSGSNGLNVISPVNSGTPGASNGSYRIANTTGGTLTQNYTGSASNPVIAWGTSSGTPAVTASAPLSITSATGNITCSSCLANPSPSLTTPSLGVATATSINGFIPDNTAWTTYTPTITCASGGPPTVTGVTGAYKKQNGKTASAKVNFTITALNACGGGSMTASGPPAPSDPLASTQVGSGYDGSINATVPTLIQSAGFVFVTTPAAHSYAATGIYETN